MRRSSQWLIGLAVLVLVVAAAILWGRQGDKTAGNHGQRDTRIPVVAAAAVAKDMPVFFDGLGTVQAYNTVTVRSRVDGELIDVAFVEGQDVHAGQVLARIDPRTYQAQLDNAVATKAKDDAQLADARLDLERYTNLGNRVSGQTLDTQRALVKQLEAATRVDQANIDSARTMLSYTTITSPIDGRTGIRQVDKGNIVHASDTTGLVVITQLQPISVVFTLPQQTLPQIAPHMDGASKLPVFAMTSDTKAPLDKGQLELIDNQIDQATGTIKLKSTFPNAQHLLWPGGFVNVRLLVDTHKNATVIPTVAIQRGPQGPYVFVLKADNTVELRPVSLGIVEDTDAEILKGVSPDDKVIVDGMAKLQNGSAVTTGDQGGQAKPAPGSAEEKRHGKQQGQ
jgi:multidrug efflux system membrane fusion protein